MNDMKFKEIVDQIEKLVTITEKAQWDKPIKEHPGWAEEVEKLKALIGDDVELMATFGHILHFLSGTLSSSSALD